MTDEDWLTAYLLRFGTATISSVGMQDGEAEFLIDMQKKIGWEGLRTSWSVIRTTYEETLHAKSNRP